MCLFSLAFPCICDSMGLRGTPRDSAGLRGTPGTPWCTTVLLALPGTPGTLWYSGVLCGTPLHSAYSTVLSVTPWHFVVLCGTPWYSAYSAVLQALRGSPPYSVVLHGFMGAPGTREYSASSAYSGLSRVLHVLRKLQVLPWTPGYSMVLWGNPGTPGTPRFPTVLHTAAPPS